MTAPFISRFSGYLQRPALTVFMASTKQGCNYTGNRLVDIGPL